MEHNYHNDPEEEGGMRRLWAVVGPIASGRALFTSGGTALLLAMIGIASLASGALNDPAADQSQPFERYREES